MTRADEKGNAVPTMDDGKPKDAASELGATDNKTAGEAAKEVWHAKTILVLYLVYSCPAHHMPMLQTLPCFGSGTGPLLLGNIWDVLCRLMLVRRTERCQMSLVSSFAASGLPQTAGDRLQ